MGHFVHVLCECVGPTRSRAHTIHMDGDRFVVQGPNLIADDGPCLTQPAEVTFHW